MPRHPKTYPSGIPMQKSFRRNFLAKDSHHLEMKSSWVKFDFTGYIFPTAEKARRFANGVQTGYRYFATVKTRHGVALYRAKSTDVNKVSERLGMHGMNMSNRDHW